MDLPQIDSYRELLLNDVPLLDVRAPVEFQQGAFPSAVNLPLLNNEERQAIGIRYKEQGQQQAITLGHSLVSGSTKVQRVHDWVAFTQSFPQGALYCFRGGLRSKITQQWIYDQCGVVYPRIKGGYKALRRFLINALEESCEAIQPIIVSGRTGVGKTQLLQRCHRKIDLENLFNHRGSAFGKQVSPQPGQIDIENALSIALLKLSAKQDSASYIVFEDEAANIGSRRIPDCLFNVMKRAPLVVLEAGINVRVENVYSEYIINSLAEHRRLLGDLQGFTAWGGSLFAALQKIQRRLGGLHYKTTRSAMEYAIEQHRLLNDPQHHKIWIHDLLVGYYDPMYDYQLSNKTERLIFQGDFNAVLDFITARR